MPEDQAVEEVDQETPQEPEVTAGQEPEEGIGEEEQPEEVSEEEVGGEEIGEDDPDSPLNDPESPLQDVLAALGMIDEELERVRKKNITNLKYELQYKVYPIIKTALEGIIGWIADEQEEDAREAYEAGVEELREVCKKILSLSDPDAAHAEILGELTEWAKEKLSHLPEEEPIEEEPGEKEENTNE
jgi:hypothetical protein